MTVPGNTGAEKVRLLTRVAQWLNRAPIRVPGSSLHGTRTYDVREID